MESSWSVGTNMTYWAEKRKKGSRNEEIKVEADEPDVQKTESISALLENRASGELYLINLEFRESFRRTMCSSVSAIKHNAALRNLIGTITCLSSNVFLSTEERVCEI